MEHPEYRLIRKYQRGKKKEAMEQLFPMYSGMICTWAKPYVCEPILPLEDLVQEGYFALEKAVRLFKFEFKGRLSTFLAWHLRAVMQKCVKRSKVNRGTKVEDFLFDMLPTVEPEPSFSEETEKMLKTLDPRDRKILVDRFINGQTLQSIGDYLGITKERTRQVQSRALRKLKGAFTSPL